MQAYHKDCAAPISLSSKNDEPKTERRKIEFTMEWNRKKYTAEQLNANIPAKSILSLLDIRFTEIGDKVLKATMPVDERTHQIYGILHGGATCVLTETVGSIASILCIDEDEKTVVGSHINANHLRPVKEGLVECICRPIHIGRTKHV